jgi:hypothetical protein
MPDKDGWLDLATEDRPPEGERVEVKGLQNLGGSTWAPFQTVAVLKGAAGWFGEHGGDHLNLASRYRLTHWRPLPRTSGG